jgi:hypothetical protein
MQTIHGFPLEQVFREAHLSRLGATLDEFQKNPQGTLEKCGQHDAITIMRLGHRPLLSVQVRLRETLLTQWRAEGTWDDSLMLHSTSSTNRFRLRMRQAMGGMLDTVKQSLTKHGRAATTGHVQGQVVTPSTKRHQMSHGMT